jgi:hypothetical protein
MVRQAHHERRSNRKVTTKSANHERRSNRKVTTKCTNCRSVEKNVMPRSGIYEETTGVNNAFRRCLLPLRLKGGWVDTGERSRAMCFDSVHD